MHRVSEINRRLRPSQFDSDYYLLTKLRSSILKIIGHHFQTTNGITIFDYGCGDIPYKSLFDGIAKVYVAGDIPGNKYADIVIEPSGHVPCEDETFDAVLSIQVLEHVPDFNIYLSEAKRLLRENGMLILSTHGWWTHHPYPNDYWRWTREGLIKILNANAFEVIETDWVMGMLAYSCQLRVQCWKGLLKNRGALAAGIFRSISFVYQHLMSIADKITPNQIGQDNAAIYVVLAKKKH